MPATSILLKFRVHSLTDTYHAVGTSIQGSFNKDLGKGRDLIIGGGVPTTQELKDGVQVDSQLSLEGKYGEFTIRIYAENELGLRSNYVEVVKQVMGASVDGTYSFGDVSSRGGKVVSREFTGASAYAIGNTTKVNIDFSGDSPSLDWRLLAPPGHALEGSQLDSSTIEGDGFFNKFVISFWREANGGAYTKLTSDDDSAMIREVFGDVLEKKDGGAWETQTFSLDFPGGGNSRFIGLAGSYNSRKILIKVEAHAIKFNANDAPKISYLEATLENRKTLLKTNFVETVANDFIFSYEAQDVDLSRVEVLQYRKKDDVGGIELVKVFEGPAGSGVDKVQLGTIKAQQKWSNGRGDDGITSLVNIYKYVIAVYDSFGLSSAYAPKVDGGFEEKDSIADALTASDRTFESVVKIGNVTIADVADKFNISWSLVDARGNGISFDNDSNSDFASVVSGVVGYFHRAGDSQGANPIIDAFKVQDTDDPPLEAGDRFTSTLTSLNISKLKQEYGVTLIPNISKDENKRIQENLYADNTREASRSMDFTLKLLDSRGEVIDELSASGTNARPAVLGTDGKVLIHNYTPVGSISIDFKFNENVEYIKVYRKPHRIADVTATHSDPANDGKYRYVQRSPRTSSGSPFGLTEKTPWAEKYNAEPNNYFGSGGTAAEIADVDYLVSTQRLSDPNSSEADPGKSNATVVDMDVPITQLNSGGSWNTELLTSYDYVIVPYDTFGAGDPYLIPAVEVIAYHVTTEDDEGFVGFMDVIPPPAPVLNTPIKTSFKTFFLDWHAPPGSSKVDHYRVTMIRDSRPLKLREEYVISAGTALDGSSKWPPDINATKSFTKWIPKNESGNTVVADQSWAAVSSGSEGVISKVSVTENTNPSGIERTRSAAYVDGELKVEGKEMWVHKADGVTDHSLNNLVTIEEYVVNSPGLAIEGETNETGYFFIEAVDRMGNRSIPHDTNGTEATLGQSAITDVADFEKEITSKFPSAVALVPDEPFTIDNTTGTLSWSDHIIYRNGEGVLIEEGSIKLQPNPATPEQGWEFLGPDVTPGDYNRIPGVEGVDKPTRAELNDRYIKSIYWDPAGGYDTSDGTFKSTQDTSGKAADVATDAAHPLYNVDENIEYQKVGFYSFSIYNPASATLNLKDELHDTGDNALREARLDIVRWGGTFWEPIASHYNFKDFVDLSSGYEEYPIDVTNFVAHFKDDPDWGDEVIKYHLKNEDLDDGGTKLLLVDAIRKYSGIHMPLESKGEGLPVSPGLRNPLVKAGSKSVTGSVTIARINRMPNGDFSTTSQWHAFANAVIGTAMIDDASIKTAHVNDLSADVITAGEIGGHEIILGEKRAVGEPVDYGSIRSKGYGGIYSAQEGFVISGDGTFSFSTAGTSLSFGDEGLLLRGTLTQPDGLPSASIRLRSTADQFLISDFQVPGDDSTASILSPSGGEVTIYADIKGAFDSNGKPLTKDNIDVIVYPESRIEGKNPVVKTGTWGSFVGGTIADSAIWWWAGENANAPVDNLQFVNDGNINEGVSLTLNFGPEGSRNNKFVKRVGGEDSGDAGNHALADYFSVEIRLKYVNEPSGTAGGIEHEEAKTYRVGDYVISNSYIYQATDVVTGTAPSHSSGTPGVPPTPLEVNSWKWVGYASLDQSFVIASDLLEINQLREASDALSFALRPNAGTVMKGGGGETLDFTPWLIYGATASYDLTDPSGDNPAWVNDSAENILITREVVAEPSDYAAWDQTKNYAKGEVVVHDSKIFTCYLAHTPTATTPNNNAGKWQEETSTAVSASPGANDKITWKSDFKLGNGDSIEGNKVKRDSFGINGDVKFSNILFTMTQYSDHTHDTELGILDTIKFTLIQNGNSAGELSFYKTAYATPKYSITRGLVTGSSFGHEDGKRLAMTDEITYFECRFFEGAEVLPTTVKGSIKINVAEGAAIKKNAWTLKTGHDTANDAPVTIDQAAYNALPPTDQAGITDQTDYVANIVVLAEDGTALSTDKYDLTTDDDDDVGRIALRVKLLNAAGETVGVGSEQIDIISVKPEHKAFRLSLKRGFIEFSRGSNAVNDNLLSPTNIVPLQVFYGEESVANNFIQNDGFGVVPSFGWVAAGNILHLALTSGSASPYNANGTAYYPNILRPHGQSSFDALKAAIQGIADSIPQGDINSDPYYIYKEDGDYKMNVISSSGNVQTPLADNSGTPPDRTGPIYDFFFYIPEPTTGPAASGMKHGLTLKATYNRPAGGIVDEQETYEDIEEINIIEIPENGVSAFWSTSDNQNIIVAADSSGKMTFGSFEGLGEVNVYRGNEEIFLAPKSITLNGDTFDLSDTLGSILKYEKANASALTTAISSVGLTWEAGLKAAANVSFEEVQNGTPDTVRISASGDSFPQGTDNQKRHVVIMEGPKVLQFGDFKIQGTSTGMDGKYFSQTDFIAWPDAATPTDGVDADITKRPAGLDQGTGKAYGALEIKSGAVMNLLPSSPGDFSAYRLVSNFGIQDSGYLTSTNSTTGQVQSVSIAGMVTKVRIYDNALCVSTETSFERTVGLSKTGAEGPSFAYRGEYSPFKKYRGDTQRIDVVKYTNPAQALGANNPTWYKAKAENGLGTAVGVKAPGSNDWWQTFNELQSTATDLLLADDIFVKKGIVTGIDREVGSQQKPSFIASQLESRYYNLDASFDQLAMARLKLGIDFTDEGTPISNTHSSLESYLTATFSGSTTFAGPDAQGRIWYLDQTDWDHYIKEESLSLPSETADIDAWARNQFLTSGGDKTNIRLRQDVPDSATNGTRSIRSKRSQKTFKTPNDKLPGFFLGFDKIDTSIAGWSSAGVGAQIEEDFYVPKFELRSVFGNFLYWDGMNLNIKGAIINASVDDHGFRQLMASDTLLELAGPANPDIGGQTFIGGGFNNELTPSLDNLGSSIMGGGANRISKNETAINPRFSVIGGGYGNEIHNPFSFIGGGYLNRIGGFVTKGETNPAKRSVSGVNSIVGGSKNEILYSDYCAVGTGFGNTIQDSKYSTILNGYKNAIDGGDLGARPWLDPDDAEHWDVGAGVGPDFNDDLYGGTTGAKCTIAFPGGSADPFEWKPFRHLLDGRAGEEEIRRFYKYAMSADVAAYSEGVDAKNYNVWDVTKAYDRNEIVQYKNEAWVCGAGNYPVAETSTGDEPTENSGIWYNITLGREVHATGDGHAWINERFGNIPWGAMGDPRFGKGAKWALDIGLDKETHYINGSDRLTGFQKFLKWEADQVSNEQANGDFDWNGKTWIKTVLPAASNKNSSFAIFNDLKRVQDIEGTVVNNGSTTNHISIFDTGYTSGDRKIYIRALSKAEVTGRQFDLGYYKDGDFYWIPITTSTWGWPIVRMEARVSKGVFGTFKLGDVDTIFWEAIGTPDGLAENTGAKALMDVFDDISNFATSEGPNQRAFKSPIGSLMGAANGTFLEPDASVSNNAAQITTDSIVTSVPEPTSTEIGESWYNTIVGGDYNKIAKSRRSTIVGGRAVSLFQVERAMVGGMGNLLMGSPSTGGKLPKGFTVFGTENIISHESPNFIPHESDYFSSKKGESYPSIVGIEPDRFDSLANTIFGAENRARNSDRMTIIGSNNDVLYECESSSGTTYKQTGSEITILGTDNKIEVGEDVDAVNLGIFGTNFKLTQPAMVQNTFYIGNPKIESTDLKTLTRVFVAADGGMFVTGDVIAYALSDKKYKDNVKLIESPLDKLLKIRGVTFEWNQDQSVYEGRDVGVLANEVEEVLPEVVENRRTGKAVRYEKLTPLLIEAVKAQQEIIDSLTARVEALESKR